MPKNIGEITYDVDADSYLVYDGDGWNKNVKYDYENMLESIPLEEIERFLRKKKLERINND